MSTLHVNSNHITCISATSMMEW